MHVYPHSVFNFSTVAACFCCGRKFSTPRKIVLTTWIIMIGNSVLSGDNFVLTGTKWSKEI